jgi:hypothetical protein
MEEVGEMMLMKYKSAVQRSLAQAPQPPKLPGGGEVALATLSPIGTGTGFRPLLIVTGG